MRQSSHSVTDLTYHIVLVTRYRSRVLKGAVGETVKSECRRIIEHFGGEVVEMETDEDHIRLLVSLGPRYSISEIVNVLKGVSARIARRDHREEIGRVLGGDSFWSPSYYAATSGGVTIEALKKYVESQKEPERKKGGALSSLPKAQEEGVPSAKLM